MSSRFKTTSVSRSSRKLVENVAFDLTIESERIERNISKSTIKNTKSFRELKFVILNKLSTKQSISLRIFND
jgi:hypothetical protein